MSDRPICYTCVHRRTLAGSGHSRCNKLEARVKADLYGVRKGWFLWPVNFDPIWLESCDSWSDKPEDNIPGTRKLDPLVELFAMLC